MNKENIEIVLMEARKKIKELEDIIRNKDAMINHYKNYKSNIDIISEYFINEEN